MTSPYIRVPRSVIDSDTFYHTPYSKFKLLLWLINEAEFEGRRKQANLSLGQVPHSLRFICQALSWYSDSLHREKTPAQKTVLDDLSELAEDEFITKTAERGREAVIILSDSMLYGESNGGVESSLRSSTRSSVRSKPREEENTEGSDSSSSLSPSEPPTPALGGGTRGGNGRPKRQPVALPPVDDDAQRLAVALAGEFYAGMDLTPTKLDISAVRVLLVGEHLTEDQVRGIIRVNHQDKNLTYWHSPSAWLKTIGNGTKPVWRHLLEVRATKVLADGNDEGLPF